MSTPRGPRPLSIEVTPLQQALLEEVIRRGQSPQCAVLRARIVLQAALGMRNEHIAQELGICIPTVQRWRRRWAEAFDALVEVESQGDEKDLRVLLWGVLSDAPRPGRPGTFTPEQVCQILALACEPPALSGRPVTHWTSRELTEEVLQRGIVEHISSRTVWRFLKRSPDQAPSDPVLANASTRRRSRGV